MADAFILAGNKYLLIFHPNSTFARQILCYYLHLSAYEYVLEYYKLL
jgi:hypothetical protein